jgi:hypothetical protein
MKNEIASFAHELLFKLSSFTQKIIKRLVILAFVGIGKRIQLSSLRTIESAYPQKEEDREHVSTLQSSLGRLESLKHGGLTWEEYWQFYADREDGDDPFDPEVRLAARLEELGAFNKKNLLRLILSA